MYLLISFANPHEPVVRSGLSLVEAYHQLHCLGRGAIFRAGSSKYSRPIYPRAYSPAVLFHS